MSGDSSSFAPDPHSVGADFDYQSDNIDDPALREALATRIDGDVRLDTYTRQLYATDASAYEATPIGVVFPRSTADVGSVMEYCAAEGVPVLPRGGGTSLAGQSVGEAVVLDFSRYMSEIDDIDPEAGVAVAEAGITLGSLNAALEPHALKFAPDPAWGDKSTLGGAIGNNSTGSHSLKYGKTDAYVEEVEVVLADGTVTTFGETPLETIRTKSNPDASEIRPRIYAAILEIVEKDGKEIQHQYPDIERNVSGYNLDTLVSEVQEAETDPDGTVNLARLLAGSEGTLGIITRAEVSLEPIPNTKAIGLLTYGSLDDAMEDVEPILEHEPAAVELVDDVLLDLARETAEFGDLVGTLPPGTNSLLLVEFYAEDEATGKQNVADLVADRVGDVKTAVTPSQGATETTAAKRRAKEALEAFDADRRATFWKMRKSGLPILLGRTTDEKHVSFIEDCAVPPENLPEYVERFQAILEDNDTFASFYAHAGPGVLHVRPLINTKTVRGVEQLKDIADQATDLVVELDGSVSGEHGDGRARTQWNRKLYGDPLWATFRNLKDAFDPEWLLNPGNICGERDLREGLRFDPDYEFEAPFEPDLEWTNDNGMQGMVELCHGCGGCRGEQATTGGVMCPTYRAAEEEIQSTRGRANLLRQAMAGDLPREELFDEEFVTEVLDLCIGCKGCARDCPSEVDMAKLKTEVVHEYHQREGASLRDRLFANVDALSRIGSALAPLANIGPKLPGSRALLERTLGIARDRTLPTFQRQTFKGWFDARGGAQVPAEDAEQRVLLFPDTYSNYSTPEIGRAATEILEAAGVHVQVPDRTDSGRPAYSKAFVNQARETALENVEALAPQLNEGWDLVVVEPSDAVMFQSDYRDLLGPEVGTPGGVGAEAINAVTENTYGFFEYLDTFRLDEMLPARKPMESLTYHGHCHQKATKKDHHAVGVLRRAGFAVDPLDSGCCGMAGSFGYENEHFSMSKAIGRILFDQVKDSPGDVVVAPGASCRTQLGDREDVHEEPPHPIEKLHEVLEAGK